MHSWALLFGVTGFFSGVLLYVFLIGVVLERRKNGPLRSPLLALLSSLLLWYTGNFLALLLRQMDFSSVRQLLGLVEASAFASLALLPAGWKPTSAGRWDRRWRHISNWPIISATSMSPPWTTTT